VRLLGAFSSLRTAAILIATMAFVLGVATYYERAYGRDAAAVMIYRAAWFNLLWLLLAVNIFGAAAVRWPWRKRQAGFVIVHLGLLTLMGGFFLDRDRLDGQLIVAPGSEESLIDLNQDYLGVIDGQCDDAKRISVTFQTLQDAGLPSFARYLGHGLLHPTRPLPDLGIAAADRVLLSDRVADQRRGALAVDPGFPRIAISRVCLAAEEELGFAPAVVPGSGTWAVRLELAAHTPAMPAGSSQPITAWLGGGGRTSMDVGPARIALGRVHSAAFLADLTAPAAADAGDLRTLVVYHGGRRFPVPLDRGLPFTAELADDLAVEVLESYDHPHLGDQAGRPAEDPAAALDPLLILRVGTGAATARRWKYTGIMAFHPAELDLAAAEGEPELWYDHPATRRGGAGQGMEVEILRGDDGGWAVARISRSHGRQEGARLPAGASRWEGILVGGAGIPMEIRLAATMVPDAEPAPVPRPMLPDSRDQAARWIELVIERGDARVRRWIRRDGEAEGHSQVTVGGGTVLLHYTRARYDLRRTPDQTRIDDAHGFAIRLERFDEGKDIGGSSTATYASDVRVIPAGGGAGEARRITMNEPLQQRGVTLYQSSFIPASDEHGQPIPGRYAASVFTAATAPGRLLKYLGSAILVAGIITLYIMRRK
jgi:hypothetical protein